MQPIRLSRELLLPGAMILAIALPVTAQGQSASSNAQATSESYLLNFYANLASNPELAAALELSDDQKKELRTVAEDYRRRQTELNDQYREGASLGEQALARTLYSEDSLKLREELTQRYEKIFLVHQLTRLRQISKQQFSRNRGWAGGPRNAVQGDSLNLPLQLAEEIELSTAEIKSLEEHIEDIRIEMEAEIREAREKAYEKVVGQLTADQRRRLRELIGDPYDFDASSRARLQAIQRQAQERAKQGIEFRGSDSKKVDQAP